METIAVPAQALTDPAGSAITAPPNVEEILRKATKELKAIYNKSLQHEKQYIAQMNSIGHSLSRDKDSDEDSDEDGDGERFNQECDHCVADRILCDVLEALGGVEGKKLVKIYDKIPKWYA